MTTAEARLTLIAAGTQARRRCAEPEAEALAAFPGFEWTRLEQRLRQQRLLPTLGPRVLELVGGGADGRFAAAVATAVEDCRRQSTFLLLVSQRLSGALGEAGIRAQPLKGPALGELLYGGPGRRLSGDLDLLVAPAELAAAVTVVRGFGYAPPLDPVGTDGLPLLHLTLRHERGVLPPVELHWRVHWYEREFAAARLLPPAMDAGAAGWQPAAADLLAALLLFYARDGLLGLRLATDVGACWDVFRDELERGSLATIAAGHPRLRRALAVAARTAERIVGLPAAQLLGGPPPVTSRERLALALADPDPRVSEAQLHAEMGFVDLLLAPGGEFGNFLRRQFVEPAGGIAGLPHRSGVAARYALAPARRLRALRSGRRSGPEAGSRVAA